MEIDSSSPILSQNSLSVSSFKIFIRSHIFFTRSSRLEEILTMEEEDSFVNNVHAKMRSLIMNWSRSNPI